MSLFKKVYEWLGEKEAKEEIWTSISENDQVEQLFIDSVSTTQIILKHSNSCGTSFFVKRDLESADFWEVKNAKLYIIDVIKNRSVSLYLADKVGIRHESPQLFIIKDEEVAWCDSHGAINRNNVEKVLRLLCQ